METSNTTKNTLKWSAIFGSITLFISLFRDSDMFRFLDYITWQGYYLTQLLFMGLIVITAGLIIGALISGGIDLKEAVSLGREFAKTVKAAQLSDTQRRQLSEETVNAIDVDQTNVPQIPLGREIRITSSSELRPELISISGISKLNKMAISALTFILIIMVALYYFL